MIFIDVRDTQMKVSGDTFQLNSKLGKAGFGFKFSKDKKAWSGPCSLKALEFLAAQSGAVLTSDASEQMKAFQKAAEKRAAYMASRRS